MSTPTTAREALLADAIGELGQMVVQVQELVGTMESTRSAIATAQVQLAQQIDEFQATNESQLRALVDGAKTHVVKHIAAHAEAAATRTAEAQIRAIRDAAQACFQSEVDRAVVRLAGQLRGIGQPQTGASERWLVPIAAAALASALTWIVGAWGGAR